MKRTTLLSALFLMLSTASLQAQNKKELLAELENLKSELAITEAALVESKKNERVSKTKAESFEVQVAELQETNNSLLKNLNSFTAASTQKSDNIGRTLESLREKEARLKVINDELSKNDSTAIVVLTNAKQTLGENAKITVTNGAVVISTDLITLFGGDTNTAVASSAEPWLGQVASILSGNPNMALTIEGLTMTGDLNLASVQATAVSSILQKNFAIAPDRLTALAKDGNFKEGINLKIHPKFDHFYLMIRENMKNAAK